MFETICDVLYVYMSMMNFILILGVLRYGIQQPKRKQTKHYQRRISLINFLQTNRNPIIKMLLIHIIAYN